MAFFTSHCTQYKLVKCKAEHFKNGIILIPEQRDRFLQYLTLESGEVLNYKGT